MRHCLEVVPCAFQSGQGGSDNRIVAFSIDIAMQQTLKRQCWNKLMLLRIGMSHSQFKDIVRNSPNLRQQASQNEMSEYDHRYGAKQFEATKSMRDISETSVFRNEIRDHPCARRILDAGPSMIQGRWTASKSRTLLPASKIHRSTWGGKVVHSGTLRLQDWKSAAPSSRCKPQDQRLLRLPDLDCV
ncbi:hypothetical protein T440DRAFT_234196 [Plenodomus tracheiphilus IPT5]|uniref:Uncharacterized protein n=1 Tax=Plenodomus tracheiphilus IPT5 TaxID=1408161 RepID=A0A6A7BGD5_9PLEO|nr:hypothetical protein T440DRAFT_234196 [Plenodomus tracheiphilus IPT5]